jgi:hypothetical protein
MPFKSQAQSRLMHAAAKNPEVAARTGVSQKVAREFVEEGHGQKVGKLPEHKKPKGQFSLAKERRKGK